jgi:hypothetical protein
MPLNVVKILNCLNHKKVEIEKLRKVVFMSGVPDTVPGLRPIVWRLLLNMWPLETDNWTVVLEQSKETYEVWKNELII